MTPEFRDLVYAVISRALDLRDRLSQGEDLNLETEQRELVDLLPEKDQSGREEFGFDYVGDRTVFLGARYALACWIDELFTIHSKWKGWENKILERALFKSRDRFKKFWDQADIALQQPLTPTVPHKPGPNAVEAFLLCVALGFRGQHKDNPAKVREYVDLMRKKVTQMSDWKSGDVEFARNTESLLGRDALLRVVAVYGGLSILVVVVLLILWQFLAS